MSVNNGTNKIKPVSSNRTSVASLQKEIEDMKKMQNEMSQQFMSMMSAFQTMMENNSTKKEEPREQVVKEVKNDEPTKGVFEQPRADELIKVMSLCYGELNLSVNGNLSIRLDKYCDIKPVLYSTLVDIVNQNRSFAEKGMFYILDERAVYHLGLSEYYKHLISGEIMNNIDKYSESDIESILNSVCKEQRDTVVKNITQRVYEDRPIDHNKVKAIGRVCGVDIYAKVREMQTVAENMKI